MGVWNFGNLNHKLQFHMSKIQLHSIFEEISTVIFTSKEGLNEQKQFVLNFVENSKINDKDKKLIIHNVQSIKSIIKLQTYICNSLLQYEGYGLNQLDKRNKSEYDL